MENEVLNYSNLKTIHREVRDDLPQNLSLRIHRSLSWLDCSERQGDDDSKFIFLWISFNAAYAHEIPNRWQIQERKVLKKFVKLLLEVDKNKLLFDLVWEEFPKSIRLLLDNKFTYQQFWDFQNDQLTEDEWLKIFKNNKSSANRALGKMNTERVLLMIFERLYTLRNQTIHWGSTWLSSVNRDQIRDDANLLGLIVPTIIYIMLNNKPHLIGQPCYPVVD